jgi:hypothetical protein
MVIPRVVGVACASGPLAFRCGGAGAFPETCARHCDLVGESTRPIREGLRNPRSDDRTVMGLTA